MTNLYSAIGSDDYVDYVDYDDNVNDVNDDNTVNDNTVNDDSLYTENGKKIIYDNTTMLYYKTLRQIKMDPIGLYEVPEEYAFKFYEKWDPLTGERESKDPYGPIYFDPNILIKYFYTNRLNSLWVDEIDNADGYFQGYYDVAMGSGSDIYVQGKGNIPEKYLFRLPIQNCYIPKGFNKAIITYGPKLTDDELEMIDTLASLTKYPFGRKRPSLVEMKKLYDIAIDNAPYIENSEGMTAEDLSIAKYLINKNAVDKLRKF